MKGIYVLIIKINQPIQPKIGALGEIAFSAGLYAYVGSAQNNLEARVRRHLSKEKRLFWHIDYLLADPAAKVIDVYCLGGEKRCECQTAQLLSQRSVPVHNFGCSDCNCPSHLYFSESFDFLANKMEKFALLGE
ncbi:MAG: GIY-YIG nuclease family protein [Candidatus Bathyarchaeia archaeon]